MSDVQTVISRSVVCRCVHVYTKGLFRLGEVSFLVLLD